jgi:hypothetical protein
LNSTFVVAAELEYILSRSPGAVGVKASTPK